MIVTLLAFLALKRMHNINYNKKKIILFFYKSSFTLSWKPETALWKLEFRKEQS